MGNKAKVRLITLGLFLTMAFALIGSITSTVAWYAYYVRATMSFRGTSVADAEQIQVGIVAHQNGESYDPITGLEPEEGVPSIYWAKPGKGLTSDTIISYLTSAGYATTELSPVTSAGYSDNDALTLYNAPVYGSYFDSTDLAPTSKYCVLPLVFRVIDVSKINSTTESQYVENQGIWITDMETSASSNGIGGENSFINEAIRVHVEESASNRFIIKPADRTELDEDVLVPTTPNELLVGGLLKLGKGAEIYDQERYLGELNDVEYEYREHLYGLTRAQVDALGDYSSLNVTNRTTEATVSDNINLSPYYDEDDHPIDSFTARHGEGLCFNSYSGLNLPVQQYYGFGQIKGDNSKTVDGTLLGTGKKIATTGGEEADYLARVTLTIWLEGWDRSVIDEEIDHSFNLGIQFEIDSVR